jgi:predicted MPP superfamily phosphohydrolase
VVERFWTGLVLYHAVLLIVSAVVARRWTRRLATSAPPASFLRAALGDAVLWAGTALVPAVLLAGIGDDDFAAVRLLSQALFGELVALTAWIAALSWRRGQRPWAAVGAIACTTLLAAYADAYHREPTDLQVRRYAVDLTHGAPARGRIRIAQLSDIQADRIGSYEERALRTAAGLTADLVVLTGDYVQPRFDYAQPRLDATRRKTTAELNRLLREVRFDAGLGVFAVRGDVDLDWPSVFDGTAVTTLTGEIANRPLPGGGSVSLIGATPRMSHGHDPGGLLALVRQAPNDAVRIVIGHGPDFVRDLAGTVPVDLALAGHTHGGQVVLPWLGAPITKTRLPRRYASGLHDYAGVPIHVSAGVGMERGAAPQLRFLCPPEISLIEVTY